MPTNKLTWKKLMSRNKASLYFGMSCINLYYVKTLHNGVIVYAAQDDVSADHATDDSMAQDLNVTEPVSRDKEVLNLKAVNSLETLLEYLRKYPNKYNTFILTCLENPKHPKQHISGKGWQRHHIIPRHAGGPDASWNLVILTVKEHLDAHRLRYECYHENADKLATFFADGGTEPEFVALRHKLGLQTVRKKRVGVFSSEDQKKSGESGGKARTQAKQESRGKKTEGQVLGYLLAAQKKQHEDVTKFFNSDRGIVHKLTGRQVPIRLKDYLIVKQLQPVLLTFLNNLLTDSFISEAQKKKN